MFSLRKEGHLRTFRDLLIYSREEKFSLIRQIDRNWKKRIKARKEG